MPISCMDSRRRLFRRLSTPLNMFVSFLKMAVFRVASSTDLLVRYILRWALTQLHMELSLSHYPRLALQRMTLPLLTLLELIMTCWV